MQPRKVTVVLELDQGQGIADQRKAIAAGLKASVENLKGVGISEKEASDMVLITQYFDTLRAIGEHGKSTILVPYGAGGVGTLANEIRNAFIAAEQV